MSSVQVLPIVLKPCKCGCGLVLQPKTVGEFFNDKHRYNYHNDRKPRKTGRRIRVA